MYEIDDLLLRPSDFEYYLILILSNVLNRVEYSVITLGFDLKRTKCIPTNEEIPCRSTMQNAVSISGDRPLREP